MIEKLTMASWSTAYNAQSTGHLNRYIRTCSSHGWEILPVTEQTLCRYAAFRFITTSNVGDSFKTELYGIRQGLLRMGIRIDITLGGPMPRLGRITQAWCRTRNKKLNRKAITSQILARFFEHLDPSNQDHQTMRAVLAVAKFGMMRVSEYTYGEHANCPTVGDLRLYPDALDTRYMALYFSKSKCNQRGRTERVICMCACPEPCPVHETARMLNNRRTVAPEDELFRLANGRPLTRRTVSTTIKALCARCGLKPSEFTTHCLRKGGVTDTLCAGVPDSIVQVLSRHASLESLKPYKRLTDKHLGTVLSHHMTNKARHGAYDRRLLRANGPRTAGTPTWELSTVPIETIRTLGAWKPPAPAARHYGRPRTHHCTK